MDVYVSSEIGPCDQYIFEGDKREVSVVISPIKVDGSEESKLLKIISGCNLWRSCENGNCYFSLKARTENKR